MMTLDQYLRDEGLKQDEFARRIDVRQATVSRLVARQQLPSLSLAIRIERATAGKVLASSWIPDSEPNNTGAAA